MRGKIRAVTPVLAFWLVWPTLLEARRNALLSFDEAGPRLAWPDTKTQPLASEAWRAWARPAVTRALARYPIVPLLARLDSVWVEWTMSSDGSFMGGLNDPVRRRVFVALGPGVPTLPWIERAVHHEFAHILQDRRNSGFPAKAWRAANAPGFRYGTGGYDAIKAGRSSEAYSDTLAAKGVLSVYGATSIDEDWATIAEAVMVDDSAFWALAARFPRLGEKARLTVAFYRRTFPGIHLRDMDSQASPHGSTSVAEPRRSTGT